MSELGRIVRILTAVVAFVAISACTETFRNHGYVPAEDELAEILVGVDTRETVAASIGQPGTAGLLTGSGWYYVQSRFRHFAYQAPQEIDREVVAISFDDSGVVENIERFGLENGQVIVISRRVTDSNIKGIGFLRQLFGNFGKVDLNNFF